jgi:hypothetical protein
MGHDDLRIEQLANRIDLLPVVAGWIYDEWWQDVEDASLNTLTDLLRTHRVPDQMPMTLIVRNSRMSVQSFTSCRSNISVDVGPRFHGMPVQDDAGRRTVSQSARRVNC